MTTRIALVLVATLLCSFGTRTANSSSLRHVEDEQQQDETSKVQASSESKVIYGMDVSWPIHGKVSTNYAWLPHNTDPDNNPTPVQYINMPVNPLGDRLKAYTEHLDGCRKFYQKTIEESDGEEFTCDMYDYDRMLMNVRQPQSMVNYTEVGFKKVRAPDRVVELIKDFWEKNKNKQTPEVWPTSNIYVNHWKTPTNMVSIDDKGLRGSGTSLKMNIWNSAKDTIQEWTGEDITPVSMYGVRVYGEGAVVSPHVDRLPLVASAMVLVSSDVDEDWPTEIYDHSGTAHNITMKPGDMLLFESHSVMHGRPFPLKGRHYAMLYIHFEPTGHSKRKNANGEDVDKLYKQAADQGVGGQSATAHGTLPPYIQRFSPEEEHWLKLHPEGWVSPAQSPRYRTKASKSRKAAITGDVEKLEEELSKAQETEDNEDNRDNDSSDTEDSGASSTTRKKVEELINERDDNGWQPIHEAAENGHKDIVELLVSHGANINSRTHGGRGGTPLYIAKQRFGSRHAVVRYLMNLGALHIPPDNSFRSEL